MRGVGGRGKLREDSFYLYAPLRRHLEVGLPYTWPWKLSFFFGGGGGGVSCSYIQSNSTCFNQSTMTLCLFSLCSSVARGGALGARAPPLARVTCIVEHRS